MKERLQFEQRGIVSSKKLNLDDKYFSERHTQKIVIGLPNFTFYGGRKEAMAEFSFSSSEAQRGGNSRGPMPPPPPL